MKIPERDKGQCALLSNGGKTRLLKVLRVVSVTKVAVLTWLNHCSNLCWTPIMVWKRLRVFVENMFETATAPSRESSPKIRSNSSLFLNPPATFGVSGVNRGIHYS